MVGVQQQELVRLGGREAVSLDALLERSLVRRLAGELPRETPLPTGLDGLDRALRGGLPRGRLVEITGPPAGGRLTLALRLAAAATAAGEFVTLVDAPDALDPRSAKAAGLDLHRFLWVRPRRLADAFKAADLVLRTTGFGLLLLYLCDADLDALEGGGRVPPPTPTLPHAARGEGDGAGRPGRAGQLALDAEFQGGWSSSGGVAFPTPTLPHAARGEGDGAGRPRPAGRAAPSRPAFVVNDGIWLRLIRAAERSGAAVVVIADRHVAGTFATATLELTPAPPEVRLAPGQRSLLVARGSRLEVTRSKIGRPTALGEALVGKVERR